jgi:hypothetical protein
VVAIADTILGFMVNTNIYVTSKSRICPVPELDGYPKLEFTCWFIVKSSCGNLYVVPVSRSTKLA